MTAEMMMKTRMNALIIIRVFFSSFFFVIGTMKSSVSVELDVRTSDERVDIEAERTRISVIPMMIGERFESIVGIISSKPFSATSTLKILPKPPRK